MDIGSGRGWPSSALSNFAPHPFTFDGIECASMEGLLQAFKSDKIHIQREICKLVGRKAKNRGKNRNKRWKSQQKLWWNGKEFDRHGPEYQQLLDRAFEALAENEGFKRALLATGNAVLKHTIGKSDPRDTVLTKREFVSRLTKIRMRLQTEEKNAKCN
ncbi:MAG: hypothetical protein ACOZAO_03670 [Patescibacteria group bacterium]